MAAVLGMEPGGQGQRWEVRSETTADIQVREVAGGGEKAAVWVDFEARFAGLRRVRDDARFLA